MFHRSAFLGILTLIPLPGCGGNPAYLEGKREAQEAGAAYEAPRPERALPPLAEPLRTDDLLRHAFLANAALEADWRHWMEALERIPQAAAWDDPRLRFEYLTSSGRMRAWDRTTLELSQDIPLGGKRALKEDAAVAAALKARRHFESMKFEIQRKVLSEAADYALLGKELEIRLEELELLKTLAGLSATRHATGKDRQESLLKAHLALEEAESALKTLESERAARSGALAALLGREDAALLPFPEPEAPEPLPASDEALIRMAAERSPELSGMAAEVRGREDALAYARRAWVPDLMLGYEVMGDIQASLTGAFTLPLRGRRIRAGVAEAREALRAAEAHWTAARDDLRARLVSALSAARDAERQSLLYRERLLPLAEQALQVVIAAGSTGQGLADIVESQRMLLALRLGLARTEAARAKATAELEAILAMDRGTWTKEANHEDP